MQRISYKNNLGQVDIFVNPDWSNYIFGSVEGLNEFSTEFQSHKYPSVDGVEIDDITYEPRIVTVQGFIDTRGNRAKMYELRKQMARIINGKDKGVITYINDNGSWETSALPIRLTFGTRMENILPFSIDFCAYNFYWSSIGGYEQRIATLVKLFSFTTKLPMRFGRTNKCVTLVNKGDVETGAAFVLKGNLKNPRIENNTTGVFFMLDYEMEPGEVVTVDSDEYSVMSSARGNISGVMTADSTFIKLEAGKNELSYTAGGVSNDVEVSVCWQDRFIAV